MKVLKEQSFVTLGLLSIIFKSYFLAQKTTVAVLLKKVLL